MKQVDDFFFSAQQAPLSLLVWQKMIRTLCMTLFIILQVLFGWKRRGSAAVLSAVETDISLSACVVRDKELGVTVLFLFLVLLFTEERRRSLNSNHLNTLEGKQAWQGQIHRGHCWGVNTLQETSVQLVDKEKQKYRCSWLVVGSTLYMWRAGRSA